MPLFASWTEPFSAERQALELQAEHIEGFRHSQRMAYAAATAVEKLLREGMTEREAVALMIEHLADHGVHEYFHTPFAWFGDRTAFTNFKRDLDFAPTNRRLRAGDPVILDVAPVIDGHASDIGYACTFGDNPLHAQMLDDVVEYRALILDGVKAGKTRREIYLDVDRLVQRHGYDNRHQRYPDRVIGHRVTWTPPEHRSRRTFAGFGLPAMRAVLASKVLTRFRPGFDSPLWNDLAVSERRPGPGLWAIEPHIGLRGTGAKWEELLVITEQDAYWIDDAVPHVQRARSLRAAVGAGSHHRAAALHIGDQAGRQAIAQV